MPIPSSDHKYMSVKEKTPKTRRKNAYPLSTEHKLLEDHNFSSTSYTQLFQITKAFCPIISCAYKWINLYRISEREIRYPNEQEIESAWWKPPTQVGDRECMRIASGFMPFKKIHKSLLSQLLLHMHLYDFKHFSISIDSASALHKISPSNHQLTTTYTHYILHCSVYLLTVTQLYSSFVNHSSGGSGTQTLDLFT